MILEVLEIDPRDFLVIQQIDSPAQWRTSPFRTD
jgi:hypothetical protein